VGEYRPPGAWTRVLRAVLEHPFLADGETTWRFARPITHSSVAALPAEGVPMTSKNRS